MRLHSLTINGFKRLKSTKILIGDATFLIGSNNSGKSTALKAIEYLLSSKTTIPQEEFYSITDSETGDILPDVQEITMEAEFRNLPIEAKSWRGFKGRVFEYSPQDNYDTGLCIHYKKTYPINGKVTIALKSKKRTKNNKYENCEKPQDYIDIGIDGSLINELFTELNKKIPEAQKHKLHQIDSIWDYEENEEWFVNPGGLPINVLQKLPRFILIPSETASHEINSKNGALTMTLNELFEEVRDDSDNYKHAQEYLNKLSTELDPADESSNFGIMMKDLNNVLKNVFPSATIHASADLSDPDKSLRPTFDIKMASNVSTAIEHQGTGMIRAAVFALLRYRHSWTHKKEQSKQRSLIIGFEEPEIYLHPSAANQMRDIIYQLAKGSSQIIATTHSPYMIDLSKKPRQILNRFTCGNGETTVVPFNVTDEFMQLVNDDQTYVKMILKMDDYVSRAFFTQKVIIVEGDTEDIVIREALELLPENERLKIKSEIEVIKARGKATIIGLVKYLKALDIDVFIIHDRDKGKEGAECFNQPILNAVGDDTKVMALAECLEDILGYSAPSGSKPYKAYQVTQSWKKWNDIPEPLRIVLETAFHGYIEINSNHHVKEAA